jgi:hypothetical protein
MKILWAFITFFLSVNGLFAQRKDSSLVEYINLYQENHSFSYTSPYSEIGAPSKYIISGKLTTQYMLVAKEHSKFALAIIPDFTVRVRKEQSAGVRTPDFKLGASTYYGLSNTQNRYNYIEFGFSHHSNGQDAEATNTDGSINTYNGNFSTNYLKMGFHNGFTPPHPKGKNYMAYHQYVELKWNKWFAYEKALENNYGFTRLNYSFSARKYGFFKTSKNVSREKEYIRLNADFSYALNQINNSSLSNIKRRLNTEITANYGLKFMKNAFLMAAVGYYGEDPYNIYFRDQYAFLRFGISTGFIRNGKSD